MRCAGAAHAPRAGYRGLQLRKAQARGAPRGEAENESIVVGQVVHVGHRNVGLRRRVHFGEYLFREGLRELQLTPCQ